jgi:hypothetical protein
MRTEMTNFRSFENTNLTKLIFLFFEEKRTFNFDPNNAFFTPKNNENRLIPNAERFFLTLSNDLRLQLQRMKLN